MAKTMQKILLALLLILPIIGTLSGGSLLIPQTATLNPAVELNTGFAERQSAGTLSLQEFVRSVANGDRNSVVGIYVPGVLALPVGQQPQGDAGFVTREPNKTTQFNLASQYGTVGILAHNDLAGAQFSGISKNQYAIVVYGDGRLEYYVVRDIQKYQALTPTSTFSDFVNLANNNEHLSAGELFNRIYGGGKQLVFQTCIAAYGDASWGRMFIIATPATRQVQSVFEQTSRLFEFASFGLAVH